MTHDELIAWRERMRLNKKQAAEALGLSENGYGAYERGYAIKWIDRQQLDRPIPKHVALACAALEAGLEVKS